MEELDERPSPQWLSMSSSCAAISAGVKPRGNRAALANGLPAMFMNLCMGWG